MVVDRGSDGESAFKVESGPLPLEKRTLEAVPDDPGIYLLLDDRGKIIYIGWASGKPGLLRAIEARRKAHPWPEVTHFKWAATRAPLSPEHLAGGLIRKFDPPLNRQVLEPVA